MSFLMTLAILCAARDVIDAQQSPTITFISKEKVVNIGDSLELHCQVQYAKDYPLVWVKVNKDNPSNHLFISRGSTVIVPDSRYSVLYDEKQSMFTLVISKAQEIDAGEYQCQIITGSTTRVSVDVQVYIRIPPVISDNSTRSVITTVGATVTLKCYAFGFPKPLVSWRREKNELLPNNMAYMRGNEIEFKNISKDARGTYYCVADNGVSPGARRHIGVEVEFPPVVTTAPPKTGQALQYDADLHCHIEAFPSPSTVWLKDGVILNDNQHFQVSIFSTADEFTDTTLRVKRIEKKQYGNYTCRAFNKLGSDEEVIELFETVNVICPPACDIGLQYITAMSTQIRISFTLTCFLLLVCVFQRKLFTSM